MRRSAECPLWPLHGQEKHQAWWDQRWSHLGLCRYYKTYNEIAAEVPLGMYVSFATHRDAHLFALALEAHGLRAGTRKGLLRPEKTAHGKLKLPKTWRVWKLPPHKEGYWDRSWSHRDLVMAFGTVNKLVEALPFGRCATFETYDDAYRVAEMLSSLGYAPNEALDAAAPPYRVRKLPGQPEK